jgi:hypothetical protein
MSRPWPRWSARILLSILYFLRGGGLVFPFLVLLLVTVNGADAARRGQLAGLGPQVAFALAACVVVFFLFVRLPARLRRSLRAYIARPRP